MPGVRLRSPGGAAALLVTAAAAAALAGCSPPPPSGPPTAEVTSVTLGARTDGLIDVVAEGVVRGIAEDGGRCRFTFWAENGAASRLTGEGSAVDGATRCGPVSERADWILPYGTYEVELRYDSARVALRSERIVVELEPAA